ncbi:MAG: radical SAM protein [Nitrospinota bacterium]|nr:radical SAM protein [Nitrospinota bacterium]MDH5755932.1 radical SAM protein [Nitrospinota bacterium]
MNIVISDVCNRSCPYCFAALKVSYPEDGKPGGDNGNYISTENFQRCLDFLKQSGERKLKLLGGEPTVHPRFIELVSMGLAGDFSVSVFSNGIWSAAVRSFFQSQQTSGVEFLINVNERNAQKERETLLQEKSLAVAGPRARLSFNIYRHDFSLAFATELIEKYGLKREMRLGLAHPVVGAENEYPPDSSLKTIGKRLIDQMRMLESRDILATFDCGFPLCMFDEEDFGVLVKCSNGFISICEPIIDVGADLSVWPCFPLAKVANTTLDQFPDKNAMVAAYAKSMGPLRQMGSMDECIDCKYMRRGQCCGGCVGRTIRNWERSGAGDVASRIKAPTP